MEIYHERQSWNDNLALIGITGPTRAHLFNNPNAPRNPNFQQIHHQRNNFSIANNDKPPVRGSMMNLDTDSAKKRE